MIPDNLILLTREQHQAVLLNPAVRLIWFNIEGKFIGPYTDTVNLKFIT